MRSQEAADESLEAALTKTATSKHHCEREVARREALERSVDQLNCEFEQEKTQLQARYAEDLEKRRSAWEMERDTLLTVIQKDCNSAFEQRRSSFSRSSPPRPPRPSPTSVNDSEYFSKLTVETTSHSDAASSSRASPSLISPAYSDIDSVLRETEDLIQSIM
jgi:DNA anti-recombination protein RmuC